jgi:hypothetical protein
MMEANIGRMTAIKKKTALIKKEITQVRNQLSQMDQNDIESAILKTSEFLSQISSGTPNDFVMINAQGKEESQSNVWQNIMTPSPQL